MSPFGAPLTSDSDNTWPLRNNWAISWDYGTYHILGDQRRLRRACASGQYRQSLRCSLFAHMKYGSGWRVRPKTRRKVPKSRDMAQFTLNCINNTARFRFHVTVTINKWCVRHWKKLLVYSKAPFLRFIFYWLDQLNIKQFNRLLYILFDKNQWFNTHSHRLKIGGNQPMSPLTAALGAYFPRTR